MKLCCGGKMVSFGVAVSLCTSTVTLFGFLGLKDTVLDAHFREPTMAKTEI